MRKFIIALALVSVAAATTAPAFAGFKPPPVKLNVYGKR